MSGSWHWAQSLNDGNGVQGLGAGVLSVGGGMVHHFLRMKVCQLVDLQEHTRRLFREILINIRAALSRIVGEDSKVQRVSASWLRQLFVFFFESQRRHFSRSSAGKDDLVCLRVGLSSIDSRGTLVGGPPPSSSSSRQCRHFKLPWSARKPEQGQFEHFDDQKGAKRTRSWNWKWLQNQIKLSRPFLQGFARFRLRSKCTCCLGNSRCSTVDEKSSICHDYPLVCPCFFRH